MDLKNNKQRRKSIYILLLIFVSLGPILHSFKLLPSMHLFCFNFTASAPIGLYLMSWDQTLRTGDYVILEPPEHARKYLIVQGYDTQLLLKPVAALPGERYEIRKPWLRIGSRLALIHAEDNNGMLLKSQPDGEYTVPDDKVLLVAWDVPRSFDSRYFGPVELSLVRRKVFFAVGE